MSQSPVVRRRRGSVTSRALILIAVAIALVVTLAVPVRSWLAQRAEIAALQADVDAARLRVNELTLERERWSDPAFVAAEARRRLHFVLPGEVGYTTLGADGRPVLEAEAEAEALAALPWHERLWLAVQEADAADTSPTPAASSPAVTVPDPAATLTP